MIIKKYTGKTEDDAVAAAKKELGTNIVIMNVKNVKPSGLFRFFKPQLIEVTVAREEENEKAVFIKKEAAPEESKAEAQAKTASVKEDIKRPVEEIGQKLDSLQSLLEKQIQSKSEEVQPKAEETSEEEGTQEKSEQEKQNDRFMKLLYNTMIENEVSEKYANQIIDGAEKNAKSNTSIDALLSTIYQRTILKFGQPSGIKRGERNPKVVFFIGPTGVGKTTTIAKIASKFCVMDKCKVALLTADTYRIAATEQLRTYASILEVPLRVIYTVEDMKSAIADFMSYDYILVDTAGHSYKNEEQRNAMLAFLNGVDESIEKEVYLVLSATTKYKDLLTITDTYAELTQYKLIFTKLDETSSFGNLLNIKLHTGAEMSYVTCGQNVPDDIEDFNPQRTVRMLLGGKNE
ncbi:MAG: flagellar biosynthesis protein FlhF [Lachnospiraceae bacterium]|nr:flagellar biosynthesis protein FlhF [Lachnospiraceae bacterium]